MLLRPLYESWLIRSTQAPLAPWQRRLLLKALQRDEALRCLAAELAEFSHSTDAPAALKAPDLSLRLRHLAVEEAEPIEQPLPVAWAGGLTLALLLAVLLSTHWADPQRAGVEVAQVKPSSEASDLRLPSLTPTPTVTPTTTPASLLEQAPKHIQPGPAPTAPPH